MTHQEQYTKLTGITVPLNTPHMPWHLMAVMSLIIKDRFKMAASWEATLLRFSMKSTHTHHLPPTTEPTTSVLSSIFGILQGNKSKHTLYGWKGTAFFQLNTVHGKTYFSYENIWKECFQDLCHCALFTSQMLSRECVQSIKTMSLCIGIL